MVSFWNCHEIPTISLNQPNLISRPGRVDSLTLRRNHKHGITPNIFIPIFLFRPTLTLPYIPHIWSSGLFTLTRDKPPGPLTKEHSLLELPFGDKGNSDQSEFEWKRSKLQRSADNFKCKSLKPLTHIVVGDVSRHHGAHEPADGGHAVANAHQGASIVGREFTKVNLEEQIKNYC